MKFKNETLIGLILFVGLLFRIHNIGTESLWGDEGLSVYRAKLDMVHTIYDAASHFHPPLYFSILHFWIEIFGDAESSVRSLSTVFGVLSLLMMFKIGTFLFNRNVGILSSLLLALSVFHISYSQEARMYSLMALLTLFSFHFFIKLLKEESTKIPVGFILSTSLLMYSHNYGLFIVMAQNIYFFLVSSASNKTDMRRWLLLQGILFCLYLPWIYILILQVALVQKNFWISTPTVFSIIDSLKEYSGSTYSLVLLLVSVLLSFMTLKRGDSNIDGKDSLTAVTDSSLTKEKLNNIVLLSVWLLTPIVVPFIVSLFSQPIYFTRYTISASLAFYLLAAKGIDAMHSRAFKALIIFLIIIASLVNIYGYFNTTHKEQWRDVAGYLAQNTRSDDLILLLGGKQVFDYYFKNVDVKTKQFPFKFLKKVNEEKMNGEKIEEVNSTVRNFNRVWILVKGKNDDDGLIRKTLSERHNLLYHKKYIGIEVDLFAKK